jgi:hypothetical protein
MKETAMSQPGQSAPRFGRRRMARAVGVTLLVALLFSITLYLSSPQLRVWLSNLLSFSAPYGTAGPVHLERGAPWGTLAVDGKRVDAVSIEISFGALDLAPGAHRLVYTADLFPTLTCVISAEAQSSDTCPLIRNPDSFERNVILRGQGRIVDLGATPVRLGPRDQETLTSAIDFSLFQASAPMADMVAVGDRYRNSADTTVTASAPLTAQLRYELNCDQQCALSPEQAPSSCVTICDGVRLMSVGGAPTWDMGVHAILRWSYTPEDGAAEMAAPAPAGVSPDEEIEALVRRTGIDHWQVSLRDLLGRAPICSVALRQVQDAGAHFASNVQAQVITGKNPAHGCVIAGISPSPNAVAMRFLYRFGVIFALDQATHDRLPALLEATPAEQAIATEIGRGMGAM